MSLRANIYIQGQCHGETLDGATFFLIELLCQHLPTERHSFIPSSFRPSELVEGRDPVGDGPGGHGALVRAPAPVRLHLGRAQSR